MKLFLGARRVQVPSRYSGLGFLQYLAAKGESRKTASASALQRQIDTVSEAMVIRMRTAQTINARFIGQSMLMPAKGVQAINYLDLKNDTCLRA